VRVEIVELKERLGETAVRKEKKYFVKTSDNLGGATISEQLEQAKETRDMLRNKVYAKDHDFRTSWEPSSMTQEVVWAEGYVTSCLVSYLRLTLKGQACLSMGVPAPTEALGLVS
jgi:hypothetical protein